MKLNYSGCSRVVGVQQAGSWMRIFEVRKHADGSWFVCDAASGELACVDGELCSGLSVDEADHLALVLNCLEARTADETIH